MATSPNYGWSEPDNSSLVKDGAQAMRTLGDAIDTSLWNSGYGQAAKNKIINGDFTVNQRSFISTTTSAAYGFDRFQFRFTGGTNTYSAQTFTPGAAPVAGYEATNFARIVTTGQSAAGDFCYFLQRIEDVRTFAGQTVTISFWAKASSGTPNVGISFEQSFGGGGSSLVVVNGGVKAITTSWARYSATVTIPSVSGKTIGTSSLLAAGLFTSAGATLSGAGYPAVGIQNTTIDFWGVQVEYGSKATPFQTASGGSIQGELAMCQRYYFRFTGPDVYSTYGIGYYTTTTAGVIDMPHPVPLRTKAASVDFGNVAIQNASAAIAGITGLTISQGSLKETSLDFTVGSGGTLGQACRFLNNANANGFIGLSAEL
jgi:hypothetical protein